MSGIFQAISFRNRRPQCAQLVLEDGVSPLHDGQTRCVVDTAKRGRVTGARR